MTLHEALELGDTELVAFVGAGGKKTAMARLATTGTRENRRVGYTTTTHMPPPEFPVVVSPAMDVPATEKYESLVADSSRGSAVAFGSQWVEEPDRAPEKLRGYAPADIDTLSATGAFDWVLVKADGARRREFKAPADHEPALPNSSTVVVIVASVKAVGEPLSESIVHRPERVTAVTGLDAGAEITPEAMGSVIASTDGGLKGVPDGCSVVVMVNKAESTSEQSTARSVLQSAFERSDRFSGGLITSFRDENCLAVSPDR